MGATLEEAHPASVDEMDAFDQNIDASGKSIPGNVAYEDLAKRIAPIGEILYFDYGVVVLWGFSAEEEKIILQDLLPFQEDVIGTRGLILDIESMETEQFYFHYNCTRQLI